MLASQSGTHRDLSCSVEGERTQEEEKWEKL
ncbi:hypothetical protein LCGC14_2077200 [marine sediment metagenome]|uniref:Uncharacterized protein n=1 Tax=marine sediment metagenome TaxID=412755 RepID=A0A0F9GV23_9ZZZZ